ncbi:hypothetical protein ACETRX_36130 [Labrys portucalensis]|uniref:Uncharacterized protein n=1 Tax=Labrys neptuniae TaxID=376174 RepID=A0ABV6ZSA2_9HYPH
MQPVTREFLRIEPEHRENLAPQALDFRRLDERLLQPGKLLDLPVVRQMTMNLRRLVRKEGLFQQVSGEGYQCLHRREPAEASDLAGIDPVMETAWRHRNGEGRIHEIGPAVSGVELKAKAFSRKVDRLFN